MKLTIGKTVAGERNSKIGDSLVHASVLTAVTLTDAMSNNSQEGFSVKLSLSHHVAISHLRHDFSLGMMLGDTWFHQGGKKALS